MPTMQQHANAIKRLLRDFKEVLEHPLPNVVAYPLEDDIFTWHGNVRGGSESVFTDTPFHFKLTFPATYPLDAPKVDMYTRLPHPNIVSQTGRPRWRLAIWDCSPTENGWSCAYTVHSILLQLQAFLIAEDMMWHTGQITLERAIEEAAGLTISDHSHTGGCPVPPFHSEETLAQAAARNKKRKTLISAPLPRRIRTTLQPQFLQTPGQDPALPVGPGKKEILPGKPPASLPLAESATAEDKPVARDQETTWQVVQKKAKTSARPVAGASSASKGPLGLKKDASPVKEGGALKPKAKLLKANPFAALLPSATAMVVKEVEGEVLSLEASKSCSKEPRGKAAKRNARRSKQRAKKSEPENTAPEAPAATSECSFHTAAESMPKSDDWETVPQKVKEPAPLEAAERTIAEQIMEVKVAAESYEECKACAEEVSWSSAAVSDMGSFTRVPLDIMNIIFSLLDRKGIVMLGSSCRGLRALCGEGEVWRLLLQRDFCGSQVTATQSSGWKSAYLLQSHNIVGDLQCYYSKATFEEQVLGMPAHFTVNPRTGVIDYIQVHPELLSVAAFHQGVKTTCVRLGEGDVQVVIPAYLNEDHFQRALPLLPGILRKLARGGAGNAVGPEQWLDACAKMMNTAIVLLMDKGVEASQKAINSYCSVHRLLLAVADHYELWDEAARRLDAFLSKESYRTKEQVPNLGWLIAMLAVSPKHKWGHVAVPLLLESLDRGVLWACKAKESLVQHYKVPESAGGVDPGLLDGVFEASRISMGLLAFHSAFLHYVARPPGVAIDKVMEQSDMLYGRASEGQMKRLQAAMVRIQSVSTWEQQLQILGVKPEGSPDIPTFMTRVLRRAWQRSLKKGYHAKDTDFSRIHASGVSQILLKGQSYTTAPNIKALEVMDVWRWQAENGEVQYLDSSALLYGKQGFISVVDWTSQISVGTQMVGAVLHSGDILERDEQRGMQTMTLSLADLGNHVTEIYFVASGYMGVRLTELKQPHIVIKDAAQGMVLCEYHLEDKVASRYHESSCIILCSLVRGESGRWRVQAMGQCLPEGCANGVEGYAPILAYIDGHRRSNGLQ